jgi:hypothetical protein
MSAYYIARTTERTRYGKMAKPHPVGTVLCAVLDYPEWAAATAGTVADWIRDGMTIERVPVEWVREHFMTTDRYEGPTP